MCGKDLIDSVTLSSKVCRALGATPPENFIYELFLDEAGGKISKSRGNGLTVDEWLTYASPESLSLFMYQKPKAAKKLFFDVIPKTVDEYLAYLAKYPQEEPKAKLDNPIWHILAGNPPRPSCPSALRCSKPGVGVERGGQATLWASSPSMTRATPRAPYSIISSATRCATTDFVKPRELPAPTEHGRGRWRRWRAAKVKPDASGRLQNIVYAVGEALPSRPRALLGAHGVARPIRSPRFGGFIELYGVATRS
jgi:lysyl-tRNA synthetase class 1